MKKRIVFLFGAGAVLDWGGPCTTELTELILNSGYYCKGNNKRITQHLYDLLAANYPKIAINFETILNVIEELIVYFASNDYQTPTSLFITTIFKRKRNS